MFGVVAKYRQGTTSRRLAKYRQGTTSRRLAKYRQGTTSRRLATKGGEKCGLVSIYPGYFEAPALSVIPETPQGLSGILQ